MPRSPIATATSSGSAQRSPGCRALGTGLSRSPCMASGPSVGSGEPDACPHDARAARARDAPMTGRSGIRVADLFFYPIKSCGGIAVESAEVDAFGFRNDRRWMVVDENGRFLTQRTVPLLATIRAGISDGQLFLRSA